MSMLLSKLSRKTWPSIYASWRWVKKKRRRIETWRRKQVSDICRCPTPEEMLSSHVVWNWWLPTFTGHLAERARRW
jgi:hypothetical protein